MKMNFRESCVMLAGALTCILTMQSCVNNTLPPPAGLGCSDEVVSYANDVWPIIDTSCANVGNGGCHNGGTGPDSDWREFSKVQSHAAEIKNRITRTPGTAGYMPQIGSLDDEEIRLISCWVDQGAQNN
jgi:hypothetical protein